MLLIAHHGIVQRLDVPGDLKELYKSVGEVKQRSVRNMAADRARCPHLPVAVPQRPHGRRNDGQVVVYAFPRLAVGAQDRPVSLAHEGSSGRYQVYLRTKAAAAFRVLALL